MNITIEGTNSTWKLEIEVDKVKINRNHTELYLRSKDVDYLIDIKYKLLRNRVNFTSGYKSFMISHSKCYTIVSN